MSKNILVDEKSKYFIHFLSLYYNIKNVDDSINWCNNNINLPLATINRILDITWEIIIKEEDFNNDEIIDKLVLLYINIYRQKYNKIIEYHIIDTVLRNTGKKLLNKKLIYYSNKSYQKKIKKYIYNNINE